MTSAVVGTRDECSGCGRGGGLCVTAIVCSCGHRRYGLEVVQAALKVAFFRLGMHRVVLRISSVNQPSRNLAKKAGFQLDGVLREDYMDIITGELHSTCVFSMLASDEPVAVLRKEYDDQ